LKHTIYNAEWSRDIAQADQVLQCPFINFLFNRLLQ
jgi:hypothetical protein